MDGENIHGMMKISTDAEDMYVRNFGRPKSIHRIPCVEFRGPCVSEYMYCRCLMEQTRAWIGPLCRGFNLLSAIDSLLGEKVREERRGEGREGKACVCV
jgi:hypothetical protein